ncbi:OmpA family protein [Neolewinella lacunae]|uniref:OmpA family protein n=1 Tax=Neolewinella lacunae TaxID=1517758 RepID=A0A923PJB3_9BACT|nr:OmpA family protein [Neolewinella lacunae]MBC6992776.1 OmpA family protein [Neolewinella lacunae]MDN3636020.1 OmpA family protein [Neolewinella lacunae]
MEKFAKLFFLTLLATVLFVGMGCNASKSAKGGVIGGAAGGVIGGAIGKGSGDGTKGAVIGAVIGGTAGAIIGKYMDKQAKELEEEVPGAKVDKVETVDPETGETITESVTVTFDGGVLFEFGKASLTAASMAELDRMSSVFARYPDTDILIGGHTDDVGSDSVNQRLSEKRAASVADYLAAHNVARSRMKTTGYGESAPVASNTTDAGRAQNRRVEVSIKASENLQQKAMDGSLTVPE